MRITMRKSASLLPWLLGGSLALSSIAAWSAPGENTEGKPTTPVSFGSLLPVVTETGQIYLSVDGAGSNQATGHTVQVDKPSAGATVRGAYLAAASTGFSSFVLEDGTVQLEGVPVDFEFTTPSSIFSNNSWADVTSIVKPIVDVAPAGLIDLTLTETNSPATDGEVLAVIFDDPAQSQDNTVVLFFGAQDIDGDSFNIALASPIDLEDPDLNLEFSLGISFGFQTPPTDVQFSLVDVNGERLTSSAGGQDDGQPEPTAVSNGALITVGGIGDSTANPSPNEGVNGPRTDDELYDLIPFVDSGDTTISVFTQNPSNDDNIFFSSLVLSDTAIVGEGILLGPIEETKRPLDTHTVTALVQDDDGNPVANRLVAFEVVSGPNAGNTSSESTGPDGRAQFSFTSMVTGTDELVASFEDSNGDMVQSNSVQINWREPEELSHFFCTNDVTFVPDRSSIALSGPTCGDFGTLSFNARLTNVSSQDISNLDVLITELSGGNEVCNTDFGPAGEGATLTVPTTGSYSDGILSNLETVEVPFQIGLQSVDAFTFFVDVVGVGCEGEPFAFTFGPAL